ncbi:cysteine proteinase [Backusella circina FSU 941]|nr:cysteine proteinase [Backusella circina FSU 941]
MFQELFASKGADLQQRDRTSFHWHIKDWKGLEQKTRSSPFQLDGYTWRILLFPRGNNQKKSISAYLEVEAPEKESWYICGQFALVVSNPNDPHSYFSNVANHRFTAEEVDWGFTRFYDIENLSTKFLHNNQVVLSVYLRTIHDETGILWHSFNNYDSRKETGYTGIRNQGATCYMNSLLQSLYFTNAFRKAVYEIPTENEEPTKSVALALQRLFYHLQYSAHPVSTTELTRSFGWDSAESFTQHDVQEFNRVLQDNLEAKMKGTPADGAISALFKGKMKSFIKCLNVDFESSRTEDYYDIQLNVKGCKDLNDSFDEYIAVETLEGDNKYMAEGYGLQDANKGVIFESFPPVLNLQLKRFDYDYMEDTMVKINDRHEFPAEINLDKYCCNVNKDDPYDYELHGVLVHSGDISSGHYFALLRPEKEDKWYRFDDDRVIPVTKKEVFEESIGDNEVKASRDSAQMIKRFTNAYMLVYIQKSKLDKMLGNVENDIPVHLKKRLDDEKAKLERRKKDKLDMQLHVKVAVVNDKSFNDYQGFDIGVFDDRGLEVSPGVDIFKALKTEKLSTFKQNLMEHYKMEADQFRLWTILYRQNKTIRVDQPLSIQEDRSVVDKIRETTCVNHIVGFAKLYMEIAQDDKPLPALKNEHILLFIKYFDINEQRTRGLGHLFVSRHDKIASIIPSLIDRAQLPKNSSLLLYEEVKPTLIEPLRHSKTFNESEFQHGDIICFQLSISQKEIDTLVRKGLIATLPNYCSHLYNQAAVLFKPTGESKSLPEITLVMDRTSTYSTIALRLATQLKVEVASKIRFTEANSITGQPRSIIQYKPGVRLEDMVLNLPKPQDYLQHVGFDHVIKPILFYEVLEVDVADLDSKRSMEITVIGQTLRKENKISVLVPRISTVSMLVNTIISKAKLDVHDPMRVRLFEVQNAVIIQEFSLEQTVDCVTQEKAVTIYAEIIPKDELEMNVDEDRLIQVVHYHNKPSERYGIPFRFVIIKGEPFEQTKKRLQKRTGMGDMDWKKVKLNVIKNLNSEQPSVVPVTESLDAIQITGEDALGLDHVDKSTRSRFSSVFDKGLFIRG